MPLLLLCAFMVWTGTAVIGECHHDYDPVFHTMFETAGLSFVTNNQGVTVQNKRHESKYGTGNQHIPFDIWPWNPELWFRNALTSEIVSSSRAIVHWTVILMSHQGAAGNHRLYLFVWRKVTNCWDVRSMVFLIRSSALLITMALISWSKFSVFCGFSTKYIEWTHYRNVMSAPSYVFLGLKSSDVYRQTPDIAPPFVSPNLWQ